jgi:hypothetical protein
MLYVLAVPAPQRILGGITQLADGRVKPLAKPDVKLNRPKSVCVGIHELPPWSSKFSSAPPPGQFSVEINNPIIQWVLNEIVLMLDTTTR